ncbi:hypothetical protein GGX14DRAFT_523426 [Mycena pura]|uniref:Fe2OG dioxygenase domain-containing protein n=1 Tax=Mycena pura TaxID=153505 RepID=A0AAD6V9Y8_9AGAR|nr:hypothetical protein GGX14DRAFT_523426 [Mycena pura]
MGSTATGNTPSIDLSRYRIPGHDACYYVPDFITEEEERYLMDKIKESPQQRWKQLANRRLQLWGGELTSTNALVAQPMPAFVDTYPDIIARLKGTGVFMDAPHGRPNHIIMNEVGLFRRSITLSDQFYEQYLPGQGIMPHEDGPAYFPVVATISLGSHCIFHYYQYKPDDTLPDGGRSIDPTPVLSVLLEPRSVVISEHSLYTAHLHAIREVEEDIITAGNATTPPLLSDLGVPIVNWDRVTLPAAVKIMSEGGALKRAARYSLTCRDVKKVLQLKLFTKR